MGIHRRQFLLYGKPVDAESFSRVPLGNGLILSYEKDLPVLFGRESAPMSGMMLLGHAIQTKPGEAPPDGDDLEDPEWAVARSDSWAGRWILLGGGRLMPDACGMFGIYYGEDGDGNAFASSSLALIHEICGAPVEAGYQPVPVGSSMVDYLPGPNTPLKNVKRLMNTQFLRLDGARLTPVPRDIFTRMEGSREELLDRLNEAMRAYFRNAYRVFPHILLPLSGGYDSRTQLALLIGAGVPFTAYTCIKRNMTFSDRFLPARLCRQYGIEHRYTRPSGDRRAKKSRENEFDRHTFGFCAERDREYYINSQFPPPFREPSMIVGGALWELAIRYYRKKLPSAVQEGQSARAVFQSGHIRSARQFDALDRYLRYVLESPDPFDLTFDERFFLEQRVGSWLPCIEQALDLLDHVKLQPLNSAYALSLYMSLERSPDHGTQIELIRKNAPKLLDDAFNREPYVERVFHAVVSRADKFLRLAGQFVRRAGKPRVK